MDFVEDDDPRPRFLVLTHADTFSSDADADPDKILKTSGLHAALCLLSSALLLLFAILLPFPSQTLSFLIFWISLSLLLAPFAPPSLTGGDIRVGLGDPLPDLEPSSDPSADEESKPRRRSRPQRPNPPPVVADYLTAARSERKVSGEGLEEKKERETEVEEREWTEGDLEILRKQMIKHPVGTARRWELIAAAFGGRHGVRSVIAAGKSMAERRPPAEDSFKDFLRKRKPVDSRVDDTVNGESCDDGGGVALVQEAERKGEGTWSSGEDLALLNALKAFPKDTAMRWEKVAAAVPGRSKACCIKRVAELKRDFRSLKSSET